MTAQSPDRRIQLISWGVIALTLFFIIRLFLIQVVNGKEYEQRVYRQNANSSQSVFERGTIFFTTKSGELVPAASIDTSYFVAVTPQKIVEPDRVFAAIMASSSMSREKFNSLIADKSDPYVELVHGLSYDEAAKIRSEKIAGVQVLEQNNRSYPFGSRAAQVVGVVAQDDADGDLLKGRYGVERQYDATLTRDASVLYENFFSGFLTDIGRTIRGETSQFTEGDVVLSIEPTVQEELEKLCMGVYTEWSSQSVGGIVIEPATGRVIAMGSVPTFDPSNLASARVSAMRNPLVENVYEMGSIVKPLTVAAGLDEGVITASTTYDDKGYLDIDGRHIANFDGKGRGVVTMQEVLSQSLNTGAVFVAKKLGVEQFRARMMNFGIGQETGIELPGDSKGLVKNFESSRMIEYATASYGHGFAVSPLAITRALSALANGGLLVTPHIVDSISYTMGISDTPSRPEPKRILKESTSKEISRMLINVVDKALLKGIYRSTTHTVAAKTGTAFLVNPSGGYETDRYLHTFFGYFPATKPRFLVFLYNYDPRGAQYASATLTGPFMKLEKFLIQYYEIPPDRFEENTTTGSTTIRVIQPRQ